jgi:chromosomal replication initiator protein
VQLSPHNLPSTRKEVTIELAKSVVEKFVKNVKREISIDYRKIVSDYFHLI